VRALDRKLLRDLARMKVQAAAIALVVASGVALFIAMLTTYRALRVSEHHYYTRQRFAQVWADLSRAPGSVKRTLEGIEGVTAVEARVQQRAVLDVPGLDEPASALLVSIPEADHHALNDLYLRRGRSATRCPRSSRDDACSCISSGSRCRPSTSCPCLPAV